MNLKMLGTTPDFSDSSGFKGKGNSKPFGNFKKGAKVKGKPFGRK